MNKILLFSIMATFVSCNGQNAKSPGNKRIESETINIGDTVSDIGNNIDCVLQDSKGNYWFASNGEGIYCYHNKTLVHLTENDGLCSNFVFKIEEDETGNLWFSTRDGVCKFNGSSFTDYTDIIKNAPIGKLHYMKGGLFLMN